jgi:hypothetical protein
MLPAVRLGLEIGSFPAENTTCSCSDLALSDQNNRHLVSYCSRITYDAFNSMDGVAFSEFLHLYLHWRLKRS